MNENDRKKVLNWVEENPEDMCKSTPKIRIYELTVIVLYAKIFFCYVLPVCAGKLFYFTN